MSQRSGVTITPEGRRVLHSLRSRNWLLASIPMIANSVAEHGAEDLRKIVPVDTGVGRLTITAGAGPVSYTHLTLPTNREV